MTEKNSKVKKSKENKEFEKFEKYDSSKAPKKKHIFEKEVITPEKPDSI